MTRRSTSCAAGATEGKDWIAQLQKEESEKTGITSLKVRFNSVFGYFIEVTKTNLDKVPEHYTRKQTMTNAERFITPELKEMEGKILGSEERSQKLEYELFQRVREQVLLSLRQIQQIASALAQLDVLAGFAEVARLRGYVCPEVRDEGMLQIDEGRHPVLEQALIGEPFVPNDTQLESDAQQIAVITGPNMAGKSTYIRQVALLALLAHTGSFVPAKRVRVDLVDRIFTRIGASDDLSRGQSTFMVEMTETANILNNATDRSLVVLDEVGRGTSTFDGLSLAWSIVEHLHNQVGAKTLFATHYHELTELAEPAAAPAQLQRRRPRVERADRVPAQDRRGRRGQELRHPRRAPGRRAQAGYRAGQGHPAQPRGDGTFPRRGGALRRAAERRAGETPPDRARAAVGPLRGPMTP